MQRCAQAYLSSAGSLTRCWVRAAYDLSLCNDTEAAELDKRLRLINGNVWCEIFNTPLPSCSSSGVYGSACKVFYSFGARENDSMLETVQSFQSIYCRSASDITWCSAEGFNSDFGSVTVCKYTESERSSGGSHNHLTADTPIFSEQTFPWSRWSHSVSACLFLVCVYTHTDTLVSSFYTESEICVYLEQRRFVNQTKINCQLLW